MYRSLITTNMILYCNEWEKTVQFYRDRLHLPISFSTEWFVEFLLTPISRLSIADEKRSSIKGCGGGGVTLAFEVEDIDAAWEYAGKMGLEPTVIKKHPWEAKVFHLFDPEGHRIEIWQSFKGNGASLRGANHA